jgi:hypothetical protein
MGSLTNVGDEFRGVFNHPNRPGLAEFSKLFFISSHIWFSGGQSESITGGFLIIPHSLKFAILPDWLHYYAGTTFCLVK